MTLLTRARDYPAHPDPRTAACAWIALIVAWNQPFYPLYLRWIVGGDWLAGCWTFLSTPFFLAVPAVARRNGLAGRILLPLTGIANTAVSIKAFGTASGVELFIAPILLIIALAFRRQERGIALVLAMLALVVLALHSLWGAPLGGFSTEEYAHFFRLNLYSVIALTLMIGWSLGKAAWAGTVAASSRA